MDEIQKWIETNELTVSNLSQTIYLFITLMEKEDGLNGIQKKQSLIDLLKKYSKDPEVDKFIDEYLNQLIDTMVFISNHPMKKKCKFLCCL